MLPRAVLLAVSTRNPTWSFKLRQHNALRDMCAEQCCAILRWSIYLQTLAQAQPLWIQYTVVEQRPTHRKQGHSTRSRLEPGRHLENIKAHWEVCFRGRRRKWVGKGNNSSRCPSHISVVTVVQKFHWSQETSFNVESAAIASYIKSAQNALYSLKLDSALWSFPAHSWDMKVRQVCNCAQVVRKASTDTVIHALDWVALYLTGLNTVKTWFRYERFAIISYLSEHHDGMLLWCPPCTLTGARPNNSRVS